MADADRSRCDQHLPGEPVKLLRANLGHFRTGAPGRALVLAQGGEANRRWREPGPQPAIPERGRPLDVTAIADLVVIGSVTSSDDLCGAGGGGPSAGSRPAVDCRGPQRVKPAGRRAGRGRAARAHLGHAHLGVRGRLGEELAVVWEVEPGREVIPSGALPDVPDPSRWDDPQTLGALVDAVRWGSVASADVKTLQAPFRAGIQIKDYQLEPVAKALVMPRVALLVADDVGLGKTIEAGLVVEEMLLRHRARRILVVCPASLTAQMA